MAKVKCRNCGKVFEDDDWVGLANHMNISRDKIHKKDIGGKIWAANYKYASILKKPKIKDQTRTALTEEQRQSKYDSRRELSEKTEYVHVRCPRCKTGDERFIEIEYVESPEAWIESNCYMILCDTCR